MIAKLRKNFNNKIEELHDDEDSINNLIVDRFDLDDNMEF
jgi:hypothetical protein